MRLPHTTGDEWPRPGMGVFHTTFSVGLHVSGRPVSVEMPWPFGPRNCGQLVRLGSGSAAATVAPARIRDASTRDGAWGPPWSDAEQVAELQEEAVALAVQAGAALGGIGETAAVAQEDHGAGHRLVGEQGSPGEGASTRSPSRAGTPRPRRGSRSGARCACRRAGRPGGRCRTRRRRAGTPRASAGTRASAADVPHADGAAVAAPLEELELVAALQAQLVGGPVVERGVDVVDVRRRPLKKFSSRPHTRWKDAEKPENCGVLNDATQSRLWMYGVPTNGSTEPSSPSRP